MRIRVEREVRDRVRAGDEEVAAGQGVVEDAQGVRAGLAPLLERLRPQPVATGKSPEARRADVGLDEVLLEEQPLVDKAELDPVGGRSGVPSAR